MASSHVAGDVYRWRPEAYPGGQRRCRSDAGRSAVAIGSPARLVGRGQLLGRRLPAASFVRVVSPEEFLEVVIAVVVRTELALDVKVFDVVFPVHVVRAAVDFTLKDIV